MRSHLFFRISNVNGGTNILTPYNYVFVNKILKLKTLIRIPLADFESTFDM